MSDLERQIDTWKSSFSAMESLRAADVEELEAHLRDALRALTAAGLSSQEAFMIATRRIGAPAAVEREFIKVNGTQVWSQRALWLVAGALGYIVCRQAIGAAAAIGQAMVGLAGGDGAAMGYAGLAVTAAAWLSLAFGLYYYRGGNTPHDAPALRPVGATVAALAVVLALATSLNFAGQVVLSQMLPIPDFARATAITNGTAWLVAVLVPLLTFTALLVRGRERAATD